MTDQRARARVLLEANAYMTLATAGADGRPWVSPVPPAPHRLYRLVVADAWVLDRGDRRVAVAL
jgi:hypothetical protein